MLFPAAISVFPLYRRVSLNVIVKECDEYTLPIHAVMHGVFGIVYIDAVVYSNRQCTGTLIIFDDNIDYVEKKITLSRGYNVIRITLWYPTDVEGEEYDCCPEEST